MPRLPPGLLPPLLLAVAAAMLAPVAAGVAHAQSAQPDGADDDDDGVRFLSPTGISTHHKNGAVFVADTGNHRVQVFHPNGTLDYTFGSKGSGDGQFLSPTGIDVTKDNFLSRSMVAVADTGNHRISVWHANGTFAFDIGAEGPGEGNFSSPRGVAWRSTWAPILVADTGNHRVQAFRPNGTFAFAFGAEGPGEGNFSSPWGVGMHHSDYIFVADTGNHRVQRFWPDGSFASASGSHGPGSEQFDGPRLFNVGWGGFMIADTGNHRVQRMSGDTFTGNYGSQGSGEGELSSPGGAARGFRHQIYVADTGNHRVHVLHDDGRFSFTFGSKGNITDPGPAPAEPPAGSGTDPGPAPAACSASLGRQSLDVRARPGDYSAAVRQTITNSGTAPFAGVALAASPWRAAAGGGAPAAAAVLPASATEVSTAGAGGGYAPLANGTAAAGDLDPAGEASLWFRLNLTPYGGMQGGGAIVQHVTYSVECRPPP